MTTTALTKAAVVKLEVQLRVELRGNRRSYWRLARLVAEFNAAQGWVALGYETQAEYLQGVDITKRSWYRYCQVWRVFGGVLTRAQADAIDASKLGLMAGLVEDGRVDAASAIADCLVYSVNELMLKYGIGRAGARWEERKREALIWAEAMDILVDLLADRDLTDAIAREGAIDYCRFMQSSLADTLQ